MKKSPKKINPNEGIEKRLDKLITLLENYNSLCELNVPKKSNKIIMEPFPEFVSSSSVEKLDNNKIRGHWNDYDPVTKFQSGGDDTISSIEMCASKINELIEQSNRQDEAIKLLCDNIGAQGGIKDILSTPNKD